VKNVNDLQTGTKNQKLDFNFGSSKCRIKVFQVCSFFEWRVSVLLELAEMLLSFEIWCYRKFLCKLQTALYMKIGNNNDVTQRERNKRRNQHLSQFYLKQWHVSHDSLFDHACYVKILFEFRRHVVNVSHEDHDCRLALV
jgi:hypothetical protein